MPAAAARHLAARAPGAEDELGDHEPAQHVAARRGLRPDSARAARSALAAVAKRSLATRLENRLPVYAGERVEIPPPPLVARPLWRLG